MAVWKLLIKLTLLSLVDAFVISGNETGSSSKGMEREGNITDVFNGVYTECFLHLSYSCVQRKTLLYLKELGKLEEVSVIGDYVTFVKLNSSEYEDTAEEDTRGKNSEDLSFLIDKAVDKFFNNHVMKFSALGRDISIPNTSEEFVGRKKRKGGGGGGHGGGHDDGGKKKMMMMAMMCMKMKLMMMVPAMMGMMGMMSFKGMMFSMMSFMISKMMLLMKLLEKKGGGGAAGGGGGGGGDGGWPAGGGGGGAWMPAGGDYGGGGGYDANGQWQSRSIFELESISKPVISYVTPHRNNIFKESEAYKKSRNKRSIIDVIQDFVYKPKSRNRRSIIDVIQNAYDYWLNRLLGNSIRRKLKQPYKVVNGVKYVYYPMKVLQKAKTPKEVMVKNPDNLKPIIIAEDFNKGEIIDGPVQSRMNNKKINKMKDDVNDTMDDNPWE